MSETVIELSGVAFARGATAVLEDIDVAVSRGEIYGLVGADGAGKTTLLRLAAGQLEPARGSVRVLGRRPAEPGLRHAIAYMPQGFGLYPDLSVLENLDFFADLHGLPRRRGRERSRELLARTALEGFDDRRAGALSGGMMQKLALACALLSSPQVMFLDEPTTGVDPLSRRTFWQLLGGVRAEGVTVVYATANMDEAERCDRVGLLDAGRMLLEGTPLGLATVEDASLLRVAGAGARAARAAVRELGGVEMVFPVGPALHVWLSGGTPLAAFRAALARAAPDLEADPAEPGLQDAVLRYLFLRRAPA